MNFRIWDEKEKYFVSDIVILPDGTLMEYSAPEWVEVTEYDRYIIQQSTGLRDKNGVEIYEGDIVEYFHTPAVIERVKGGFAIVNTKGYEYTTDLNGHMRILGNIYENPDLMEVE